MRALKLLLPLLLGLAACDRHAVPTAAPNSAAVTAAVTAPAAAPAAALKSPLQLALRLHAHGQAADTAPLRWTSASGQTLTLTRAALLLSALRLCRSEGDCHDAGALVGHVDLEQGKRQLLLPAVPQGDYRSLEFVVGLSPAVNHGDPSAYPAGHALNPLTTGLHWGWQGGYVFMALEGLVTGKDGAGSGFVYHLANDANAARVRVPLDFRHTGVAPLRLDLDLATLLERAAPEGLGAGASASTHSRDGDPLAQRLVKGLAESFVQTGAVAGTPPALPGPASAAAAVSAPDARPEARLDAYVLKLPQGFPQPQLPADNPLTNAGVALGKRLFFDRALSTDRSVRCASCHLPNLGFADAGRKASLGVGGRPGSRRAMPLVNLAWSSHFAWDGARDRLRDQALAAVVHPDEMRMKPEHLTQRLLADRRYRKEFAAAFGGQPPTFERAGLALEQYVLAQVSADSRVDRALKHELVLTDQELTGLKLFVSEHDPARGIRGGDCFHCHGGPLFTDSSFHNNGLDQTFKDRGRAQVTGRDSDLGKFKAPSLRNVALRPPYMHDGRFKTLEQVVEHYSSGTLASATLDPNIAKHPNQAGLNLNADEKAALVALLRALTDHSLEAVVTRAAPHH